MTPFRWTLSFIALVCLSSVPAVAQDFGGGFVPDPSSNVAVYDFHIDGPPTGQPPLVFLDPFPPALLPPVFPWNGIFADPLGGDLFSLNFLVNSPLPGLVQLSDGPADPGLPLPGLTCLDPNGCAPITLILPTYFSGLQDPAVIVNLELTNVQTNGLGGLLAFSFIDPLFIDPVLAGQPLDPLGNTPLVPPFLLPLPPDPVLGGLNLHLQAFVQDPGGAGVLKAAPALTFQGLVLDQNVQLGNSFSIALQPVPEPATSILLLSGVVALLAARRRRRG